MSRMGWLRGLELDDVPGGARVGRWRWRWQVLEGDEVHHQPAAGGFRRARQADQAGQLAAGAADEHGVGSGQASGRRAPGLAQGVVAGRRRQALSRALAASAAFFSMAQRGRGGPAGRLRPTDRSRRRCPRPPRCRAAGAVWPGDRARASCLVMRPFSRAADESRRRRSRRCRAARRRDAGQHDDVRVRKGAAAASASGRSAAGSSGRPRRAATERRKSSP